MKKVILSCLLLGASLSVAVAQNAPAAAKKEVAASVSPNQAGGPTEKREMRKGKAKAAAEAAGLTEEDRTKLRATREKRKGEIVAIKNNTALTPEQKKEQMKAKREEVKAEVDATIGKEKAEKLRNYHKANRPKGGHHGGKGHEHTDQKDDK